MRATTKKELMDSAKTNYEKLNTLIDTMSDEALLTPFDFSKDEKKKEAHWNRDKNLRDIYIHLFEWHQLLLVWVQANVKGEAQAFLPAPYNWRTYGKMNIEFWERHQKTALESAKSMYEQSHAQVIDLADTFSNDELFSKGVFDWVGQSTLGSYFVSATSSHYNWAIKKLKAHMKRIHQ